MNPALVLALLADLYGQLLDARHTIATLEGELAECSQDKSEPTQADPETSPPATSSEPSSPPTQ